VLESRGKGSGKVRQNGRNPLGRESKGGISPGQEEGETENREERRGERK